MEMSNMGITQGTARSVFRELTSLYLMCATIQKLNTVIEVDSIDEFVGVCWWSQIVISLDNVDRWRRQHFCRIIRSVESFSIIFTGTKE